LENLPIVPEALYSFSSMQLRFTLAQGKIKATAFGEFGFAKISDRGILAAHSRTIFIIHTGIVFGQAFAGKANPAILKGARIGKAIYFLVPPNGPFFNQGIKHLGMHGKPGHLKGDELATSPGFLTPAL